MADVIGYAMLQIAPSIQGIQGNLQAQLGGPLVTAGRRAGQDAGQAIAGGIAQARAAVEKATDVLAKSQDKVADAAGKVRAAEAKLLDLRSSGRSTTAQIVAAEERLETARRASIAAARDGERAVARLADAERDAANATDEVVQSGGGFKNMFSGLDGGIKQMAALSTAAAGVGGAMATVGAAIEKEMGADKLAASLGVSGPLAAEYGAAAAKAYAGGAGDSLAEVQAAVGLVASSFSTLGFEGDLNTDEAASAALAFADIFDTDITSAVQSASTLVQTGLADGSAQAFDLMTQSFQRVPAAMRDELPEIVQEYGTNFRALGFDGEEAFNLLVSAAGQGKFALDKTGDALKEFTIRGSDMSKSSIGAYEEIGLNAEEMSNAIAAGGEGAQAALQQTAAGLLTIEDPAARANAAIALFGTPLEDLSVDQIPAFLQGLSGAEPAMAGFEGALDSASSTMYDNLGSKLEVMKRGFQDTFVSLVGDNVLPILGDFSGALEDNEGNAIAAIAGMTGLGGAVTGFESAKGVFDSVSEGVGSVKDGFVSAKETAVGAWDGVKKGLDFAKTASTATVDFLKMSGSAVLEAGKTSAAWVASSARTVGALVAQGAAFVAQKAVLVAGTVATGAAAAAQWALNAAMSANPIGVLIVAITALVAGLVWFFTQTDTGKAIIQAAWQGIQTAISFAWNSVIQPIFGFFVAAFQKVGDIANWLWTSVIVPAWDGIGAAIGFAWNSIIMPAVDGVKAGFQAIGDIANWLWNNAIVPAWDGIKNAIGTAWDFLRGAFDNIKSGFGAVGDFFGQVGDTIGGVWDGIVRGVAKGVNAVGKILQKIQIPDWVPGVGGKGTKGLGDTLVNWSAQYLASGGLVAGRRRDGTLFGPGTGTSDSIMGIGADGIPTAMVSAGEGVVKKSAMDSGGGRIIAALNAGWVPSPALLAMMTGLPAYADGGLIGSSMDWARSMDSVGYGMGGFSSASIDCSGMVSGVVNTALGRDPFESRMSTVTEGEWLTERGATLGQGGPGDLRIGWWDQGGGANGHTAGTFPDGTNFESNGSEGVVIGGSTGADDPSFTDHAFFPASMFEGGDLGAAGGSGGGSAPDLSASFGSDSGASTGGTSSGGFGSGGASSVGGTFSNEQGAIKVAAGDAMPVFVTNMPTGGFGGSSSDSAVPYSDAETAQSFSSDPVMPQSAPADSAPPVGGTGVDASYGAGEAGNPEVDKWSAWAQDVGQQWQKFGEDNWREMLNTVVGLGLGGIGGGGQTTVNNYGQDPRAVTKVLVRAQNRQSRAMQRSGGLTR